MRSPGRVLVSGASIAGPTVAYWLERAGYRVTLLERSAEPRGAGQNIDVRGVGREVLRKMDLEAAVRSAGTGEVGLRFVDGRGDAIAEFPAGTGDSDGPTAEVEILRGELSRLLIEAGGPGIQQVYGDFITGIDQAGDGVDVTFAGGGHERFDLVVVAEGIRSRTRQLVFGDQPRIRDIGLYTAYGTIPRSDGDDDWWRWYNAPGGRSVQLRPDNLGTTRAALTFLSPARGYEALEPADQRAVLRRHFTGAGWETPRILDGFDASAELYVDNVGQVLGPRWSAGRVVLLGDAAWCATPLSGMGTTLAITGGYQLAHELAGHADVFEALRAYELSMRPLVTKAQKLPPGVPRLALPISRTGVAALRTAVRVAGSAPVRWFRR